MIATATPQAVIGAFNLSGESARPERDNTILYAIARNTADIADLLTSRRNQESSINHRPATFLEEVATVFNAATAGINLLDAVKTLSLRSNDNASASESNQQLSSPSF